MYWMVAFAMIQWRAFLYNKKNTENIERTDVWTCNTKTRSILSVLFLLYKKINFTAMLLVNAIPIIYSWTSLVKPLRCPKSQLNIVDLILN